MKKAFKHSAQKQDPAVFDYAREVEQVWRDFPETKDKVYFLDLCTKDLVYPGEPKRRKEAWKKMVRDQIPEFLDFFAAEKRTSCLPKKSYSLVFLWTKEDTDSRCLEPIHENIFGFDHELGHVIIPGGGGMDKSDLIANNRAECIADAYAVIRHLQRYGADSQAIDILPGIAPASLHAVQFPSGLSAV